jgi:hypothetical protein
MLKDVIASPLNFFISGHTLIAKIYGWNSFNTVIQINQNGSDN